MNSFMYMYMYYIIDIKEIHDLSFISIIQNEQSPNYSTIKVQQNSNKMINVIMQPSFIILTLIQTEIASDINKCIVFVSVFYQFYRKNLENSIENH